MKLEQRYRLMRESGVTTVFLSKKFGKHPRSIRRVISGSYTSPEWVKECRRYIARKIKGVSYREFWNNDQE